MTKDEFHHFLFEENKRSTVSYWLDNARRLKNNSISIKEYDVKLAELSAQLANAINAYYKHVGAVVDLIHLEKIDANLKDEEEILHKTFYGKKQEEDNNK